MKVVAIVGNGPEELLADLETYKDKVDYWIGADRGAFILADRDIHIEYAIGDFDSIDERKKSIFRKQQSIMSNSQPKRMRLILN